MATSGVTVFSILKRALVLEASFQPASMAKEINPNAPPGVFQMFNENRTFFFESDISALPNPPCTLPNSSDVTTMTVSKSWKSLSQPNLSVASTHSTSSVPGSTAVLSPANLHLPAAIMAPTPSRSHFHSHHQHTYSDAGTVEGRYETDPSYNSSGILKSFKHELNLFGNKAPQKSLSNPSTPRQMSSPDLYAQDDEEYRQRANSDPRKLSLVPEESAQDREKSESRVAVAGPVSQPINIAAPEVERLRPVSSDTTNRAGAISPNLQLTQKVVGWFSTPQPQVEVNKHELNAFSPSSF